MINRIGGFALADGYIASGLTEVIASKLKIFESVPLYLLIAIICTIITFLTEVTSNVATAQIFLPILAGLCIAIKVYLKGKY